MKKTSYDFCVRVVNEAIEAMKTLSENCVVFLPDEGSILSEAKNKLERMEDWERAQKHPCMAYIVDVASPIYSDIFNFLATEYKPNELYNSGLISDEELIAAKAFVRKMKCLSNQVAHFDATLK